MSQTRLGLPCLYLAIFLLALTGLFAKLIPLDAISIIQLRGMVAAIGLALFSLLRKRILRLPGIRTYAGVYALGLLLGVHWVTFFHAMQVSSVAVGMLALFSYPMITILLEPLFTRRQHTRHPQTYRADMGVRRCPECRGATARSYCSGRVR